MSPEHTSDTSTFILIFSFDFDFFGFVFDVFFFRLVELLLFELLNDIDDRRPDLERSADDRRFVLPIVVPLIFVKLIKIFGNFWISLKILECLIFWKKFFFENQLWKEKEPGKMSELNDEKSVKDSEPAKKSRKPALPDFRNIDYKVK